MKNYILLITTLFLFSACGGLQNSVSDQGLMKNPAVKDFLNRFNKEDFILKIEKERTFYEQLVTELKTNGKATSELQIKYTETQRAYDNVLSEMSRDILAVKNIVGFQLFDAESRYAYRLDAAASTGAVFTKAAMEALDRDYDSLGFSAFIVAQIFPLIKKVEQIYLSHVKNKMVERITRAEFRFWEDIA